MLGVTVLVILFSFLGPDNKNRLRFRIADDYTEFSVFKYSSFYEIDKLSYLWAGLTYFS